jgi:hypothetical protein
MGLGIRTALRRRLRGVPVAAAFGREGAVDLAPFEPHAIAGALKRLLDDPALGARRAQEGAAMAAARTCPAAAAQVEAGLVAAIAFARDPARRY